MDFNNFIKGTIKNNPLDIEQNQEGYLYISYYKIKY